MNPLVSHEDGQAEGAVNVEQAYTHKRSEREDREGKRWQRIGERREEAEAPVSPQPGPSRAVALPLCVRASPSRYCATRHVGETREGPPCRDRAGLSM